MIESPRAAAGARAGWGELARVLEAWGEPAYRARQIGEWKERRLAASFDEMREVPRALRQRLDEAVRYWALEPLAEAQSADGLTTKMLFRLADGECIESVLMRQPTSAGGWRSTVCVSSQAGCKMRCSFCATGHGGWRRNLAADEIVDQVLYFAARLKRPPAVAAGGGSRGHLSQPASPPEIELMQRVDNVVFMGMGEPLDNYDGVLAAVRRLNDVRGLGLAARSITISTCGLVPEIRRLEKEGVQVNLAVSLAATNDVRRSELIPLNRRFPLRELLAAGDEYAAVTHRRVSYEYVLIAGVNDSVEEAVQLGQLLRGRLAHVNLIPLNPVAGDGYARPTEAAVRRFQRLVRAAHVPVTVRYSKGVDIAAGCGQLRAAAS
ncbi:MAG TPA: 23S rRNA (adenine(2503)-C(2))-methyltransferase RlmN [Chloroflexota bacterium]|nr:23S rRNA (adenine(2503)-C(2))-methyltransferase RlmN [Chloroflexota bacterium]